MRNSGDIATKPVEPAAASEPIPTPSVRCKICGEGIEKSPAVTCRDCGTLHHTDCWCYNRGCSLYGCSCRRAESWSAADEKDISLVTTINYRWWHRAAFWLTFVILLLLRIDYASVIKATLPGMRLSEFFVSWSWLMVPFFFGGGAWVFIEVTSELYLWTFPQRLIVYPVDKLAVRQRRFFNAFTLCSRAAWKARKAPSEIHLHQLRDKPGQPERLYFAYSDGTRELIYDREQAFNFWIARWNRLTRVAVELAEVAGCAVRVLYDENPPRKAVDTENAGLLIDIPVQVKQNEFCSTQKIAKASNQAMSNENQKLCPACQKTLTHPVLRCRQCKAIIHQICWERRNHCPNQGCSGRLSEIVLPPVAPEKPFFTLAPKRFSFLYAFYFLGGCYLLAMILNLHRIPDLHKLKLTSLLVSVMSTIYIPLGFSVAIWGLRQMFLTQGILYIEYQYDFDPERQAIDRHFQALGIRWWTQKAWRGFHDIVEVHHKEKWEILAQFEEVAIVDRTGKSTVICSRSSADMDIDESIGSADIANLCDRVAALCDCTVSFVEGDESPPLALPLATAHEERK